MRVEQGRLRRLATSVSFTLPLQVYQETKGMQRPEEHEYMRGLFAVLAQHNVTHQYLIGPGLVLLPRTTLDDAKRILTGWFDADA